MRKKKVAGKKKRRIGPMRSVPRSVLAYVKQALRAVRLAKAKLGDVKPSARKSWRELHNVESRLSRLA